MLDWSYGAGYSTIREKVQCKNCLEQRRLDLPHQDFYCKAYNKLISQNHIDDEIECEKYKEI